MKLQGSSILNDDVVTNLIAAVNAAPDCATLASITAKAFLSLSGLNDAMAEEQAKLQPLLDLLTIPATNPAAIVAWIKNFILQFLTPIVQPALDYQATILQLAADVARLTAAIQAAEARFTNCSITIPTITIPAIDIPVGGSGGGATIEPVTPGGASTA